MECDHALNYQNDHNQMMETKCEVDDKIVMTKANTPCFILSTDLVYDDVENSDGDIKSLQSHTFQVFFLQHWLGENYGWIWAE